MTGIKIIPVQNKKRKKLNCYDLRGVCVKVVEDGANITEGLPKGVYIINNRKIVVK